MAQNMTPGQNCPLPDSILKVAVTSGAPADFSSFRLYAGGRTKKDADFVFYGQLRNDDGTVSLEQEAQKAVFTINLPALGADVEKISFAVTSDFPTIASLKSLDLKISDSSGELANCPVEMAGRDEAALILGEIYRRNGQWKFRFVAQGFRGGLKPLAEMYGVDIADDAPPPPTVNLSKIVLTKASPKVNLGKHEAKGVYRVNLNWNAASQEKKGLFGMFSGSKGIDLDLAAYVHLKNGQQAIIQALGETFGSVDHPPYVQLMGDDRTGRVADGEWLHINGDHLDEIDEIVVYTFIYEGVADWKQTDAVTRIEISGQPPIETRLNEGDSSLPMCAIARLSNKDGKLAIEKLERYFRGHRDMDKALGWGLRWQKGSK